MNSNCSHVAGPSVCLQEVVQLLESLSTGLSVEF